MPESADRLIERLRLGLLVVGAVVLLLDLWTLVADAADYRWLWLEIAGWGLLAAATVAATPFVVRHRPWGRWRWPLVIIALLGSTAATAAVAPPELFGVPHWVWDIFGYWAVLFLLDRPLRELLAVIAVHLGITVGQLVVDGRAEREALVSMAISGLALGGLPVAVRLFADTAGRAAAIAARAAAETERVRTAERVADEIHAARQTRYADLTETAGPLLSALASGELDPAEPAVRRQFFVEAARLRRLFAESDDSDDPLVHEVLACADTAMRRGVAVNVAVRGDCPPLPRPTRRELTDAVVQALAAARATARITVIGMAGEVIVTVVADMSPGWEAVTPIVHNVRVTWDRQGDRLWMEAAA